MAATGGDEGDGGVPARIRAVSVPPRMFSGWPLRFKRMVARDGVVGLRGANGLGLSELRAEPFLGLGLQTWPLGCAEERCEMAACVGLLVGQSADGGKGRLRAAGSPNENSVLAADLLAVFELAAPARGAWAPGSATDLGLNELATGSRVGCEGVHVGLVCTGEATSGLPWHSHPSAQIATGSGDETSPEGVRLPPTHVTVRAPVLSAEGCKWLLAVWVLPCP